MNNNDEYCPDSNDGNANAAGILLLLLLLICHNICMTNNDNNIGNGDDGNNHNGNVNNNNKNDNDIDDMIILSNYNVYESGFMQVSMYISVTEEYDRESLCAEQIFVLKQTGKALS